MRIQTPDSILSHWDYTTPKVLLIAISAGLLVQAWLAYRTLKSKVERTKKLIALVAFCIVQFVFTVSLSHALEEQILYAKVASNTEFAEDYNMEAYLPADPLVLDSTKRFQSSIVLCLISCSPGAIAVLAFGLLTTKK